MSKHYLWVGALLLIVAFEFPPDEYGQQLILSIAGGFLLVLGVTVDYAKWLFNRL